MGKTMVLFFVRGYMIIFFVHKCIIIYMCYKIKFHAEANDQELQSAIIRLF